MFDEMRLLPEGLAADIAPERLLAGMRPEVDLDVGLVEESAIADIAPVDGLLLSTETRGVVDDRARGRHGLLRPLTRLLVGRGCRRVEDHLRGGARGTVNLIVRPGQVRRRDDVLRTVRDVLRRRGGRGALRHETIGDLRLGRPVLEAALQERHVRERARGVLALDREVDDGRRGDAELTVGGHEVRQRLVGAEDGHVPVLRGGGRVLAGALDPGVQVHPRVAGVVPVVVVAVDGGVGDGRADDGCDVFHVRGVEDGGVVRDLRLDVHAVHRRAGDDRVVVVVHVLVRCFRGVVVGFDPRPGLGSPDGSEVLAGDAIDLEVGRVVAERRQGFQLGQVVVLLVGLRLEQELQLVDPFRLGFLLRVIAEEVLRVRVYDEVIRAPAVAQQEGVDRHAQYFRVTAGTASVFHFRPGCRGVRYGARSGQCFVAQSFAAAIARRCSLRT